MKKLIVTLFVCLTAAVAAVGQTDKPTLFRQPSISRTDIVFSYGGDLWIVPRAGGDARRLTAGNGIETNPYFSPDRTMVAFTGDYDGNTDVYVVPTAGGVPKRLTYHPSLDLVSGWTPDGKSVLFTSHERKLRRVFTAVHDAGDWRRTAGAGASANGGPRLALA